MIYKFRSKAAGDLIMLGPQGDQLLRLLGREPAPQGIFEVDAMPGVAAALQVAVAADEAARAEAAAAGQPPPADAVSLQRRVWPLLQMLERAQAAGEPIVWGV